MNKLIRSRYTVPLVSSLLLASVALAACSQASVPSSSPNQNVSATTSNNLDDLGELDKGKKVNAKKEATFETIQPKNGPRKRASDALFAKRIKGKIDTYSDSEEGATVSNFNFEFGTDTTGNGAANERTEAQVSLAGIGDHKVVLDQENFPTMSSQNDQVTVKDETTGNTRVYSADQDLFRYSVKDGSASLDIETLPDGSWLINGEAAVNTDAAAKLAMKSPIVADASLHGLMLIYQTFKQADKLPVQYLIETLIATRVPDSSSQVIEINRNVKTQSIDSTQLSENFGNPQPLLKAVIKLKKEMKKTGK